MESQNNVYGFPENNLQQTYSPLANSQDINTPTLVKIISWLLIISGLINITTAGLDLFFGSLGIPIVSSMVYTSGIISLVVGIAYVITPFGLRKMKKWALYVITFFALFGLASYIYTLSTSFSRSSWDIISWSITVLFIIYLWAIYKKFN